MRLGGRGGMGGRWLFVVLCGWLMAGVCEGQGHFRFANMYWERDTTDSGFVVKYTIRSSWQRTYPAFQVFPQTKLDESSGATVGMDQYHPACAPFAAD